MQSCPSSGTGNFFSVNKFVSKLRPITEKNSHPSSYIPPSRRPSLKGKGRRNIFGFGQGYVCTVWVRFKNITGIFEHRVASPTFPVIVFIKSAKTLTVHDQFQYLGYVCIKCHMPPVYDKFQESFKNARMHQPQH